MMRRAFQVEVKSSGRKWRSVKTETRPGTPSPLRAPTSSPRKSPEAISSARAAADALLFKGQAKK